MKEFLLDQPVSREFILFLEQIGTVEMLPNLGEGFYKFEKPDCFSFKGFLNNTSFEVRFRKEVMDFTVDFLHSLLYSYRDGDPDLAILKKRDADVSERISKHLFGEKGS